MKLLGDVDLASPKTINIYASTFADKDAIADAIEQYNSSVSEDDRIDYTDYVALLMSSVTTIITPSAMCSSHSSRSRSSCRAL